MISLSAVLTSDSCFSWYKDGELLEFSHPNYISLKDDHITIVANAINEGTYTCIVKKKDKVLTNYSWRVRVRFWRPRRLLCTLNRKRAHVPHTRSRGRPHSLGHIFVFVFFSSSLLSTHNCIVDYLSLCKCIFICAKNKRSVTSSIFLWTHHLTVKSCSWQMLRFPFYVVMKNLCSSCQLFGTITATLHSSNTGLLPSSKLSLLYWASETPRGGPSKMLTN